MRFVDTNTLKFRVISDSELRKLEKGYAILSHRWTWGEDEISYEDVHFPTPEIEAKQGFSKFSGACKLAKTLGYELIWNDTCCMNKTDSVELSEAVNSMYRWYSQASTCIAYLQDVTSVATIEDSEWFTRGWTLQELIAPKDVRFYGRDWNFLGNKSDLLDALSRRTGIPVDVLTHEKPPRAFSVAQRMSWAAKRTTTRSEDRAYSLMGLFEINMPLIYGEREGAFDRLLRNIIAGSTDESIFAWDLDLLEDGTRDVKTVYCGLLASSPACFARCSDVVSSGHSRGFHIDQFGLRIELRAVNDTLNIYYASLKAKRARSKERCAIVLAKLPGQVGYYARVSSGGNSVLTMDHTKGELATFVVPLKPTTSPLRLYHGVWLRELVFPDTQEIKYDVIRRRGTNDPDRLLLPDGQLGTVAVIRFTLKSGKKSDTVGFLKVGFNRHGKPFSSATFRESDDDKNYFKNMITHAEELLARPKQSRGPYVGSDDDFKIGLDSDARLNHELFNGQWIPQGLWLSQRTDSSVVSSLRTSVFESCENNFKGAQLEVFVSAELVRDITSTMENSRIWAITIRAQEPQTLWPKALSRQIRRHTWSSQIRRHKWSRQIRRHKWGCC